MILKGYKENEYKNGLYFFVLPLLLILILISGTVSVFLFAKYLPEWFKPFIEPPYKQLILIIIIFFIIPFALLFYLLHKINFFKLKVIIYLNERLIIGNKPFDFKDINKIDETIYYKNIYKINGLYKYTRLYKILEIKIKKVGFIFGFPYKKIYSEYNQLKLDLDNLEYKSFKGNDFPDIIVLKKKDYHELKKELENKR